MHTECVVVRGNADWVFVEGNLKERDYLEDLGIDGKALVQMLNR